MKKLSLIALAITLSAPALAVTKQSTVTVNLTKEEEPLVINQTQEMEFPPLVITRATNVGARCTSQPSQPPRLQDVDRLCKGAGAYAHFRLSGVPHADVTWTLPAQDQQLDGLKFTMTEIKSSEKEAIYQKLDADGNLNLGNFGTITLVDHETAMQSTGEKSFTYDIIAAYQ
ncbi:hypothetical protein ACSLBF_21080 (plasmid) [Pseudoalteromonas sp. T1lg65]|uniref:hypothetical protein n=1 Tax=Pseudoalteromonas sp. T1lg65 TaxID=2077101 RepID=UPI003F7AA1C5